MYFTNRLIYDIITLVIKMSKRKTDYEFKKEIEEKYGNEVKVLNKYINNKTKILVEYKECKHQEYKLPSKLLIGQKCGKCKNKAISKAKTKTTNQFKQDLINKGIEHIEVLGEYKGLKNKIKVINKRCEHTYFALPNNILRNSGCPICYGYKDTKMFIEIINKKYPNEYDIIGEYINNKTPIKIKHKCGYIWNAIPKDLLRAIRCPKCKMSKGEYYISRYLQSNDIEFKTQYKFKDCKDKLELPFDFMIKTNNKIKLIEFDGSQHYNKTFYSNSKIQLHDKMKDKFCKDNNIELLRIPYWHLRNDKIKEDLDNFINK